MHNIETLKEMYLIHSPSGNELNLARYISKQLDIMGVKYHIDAFDQLYWIENKNAPLLVAHMDQVQYVKHATKVKQKRGKIRGNGNLGADDKNGCFIILEMLKDKTIPPVNFLFSVCEETGGAGVNFFLERWADDIADNIPFALVFDRRAGNDIIGTENAYCNYDLEDDIAEIGLSFGYTRTSGVWCDCDSLCRAIPCVNLSCGFHRAHTNIEYTSVRDLENALAFGKAIVSQLGTKPKRYKVADYKHWRDNWMSDYYSQITDSKTEDTIWSYCEICREFTEVFERKVFGEYMDICADCCEDLQSVLSI